MDRRTKASSYLPLASAAAIVIALLSLAALLARYTPHQTSSYPASTPSPAPTYPKPAPPTL